MKKIKKITVERVDGITETFLGSGSLSVVQTVTKMDGVLEKDWPRMKFVTAHLVLDGDHA